MLEANGIGYSSLVTGCTPRRLALILEGLPLKQEDVEIHKTGPALSIAHNKEGELSAAGLGFLKKLGARVEDSFIERSPKGEFLAVRFVQKGKSTLELLQSWFPAAIMQIALPKKMIWKQPKLSFSRPIRWIVALWDSAVIELDFFGIQASRYSYGNRYLGMDNRVEIPNPAAYTAALLKAKVVVELQARRAMIAAQLAEVFAHQPYSVVPDERLLDSVCNLIEYPTAVIGEFDARFLALPEKIITSTISQNQKYFSVYDAQGKLANKFVFISNGDPDYSELIRAGNEKVVMARLEDAMWFFTEDCKQPLESYVPKLQDVVFQSRLGTLAAKTERLQKLCQYIARALALPEDAIARAVRTALLCKADLVTLMLGEKEFTKLQGFMGKQYALASSEDVEVAQGIYEHYMPRGSNDDLPSSLSGAICAVADKLDTVAGIIGIGMLPTGSADPFALRRAAGGVVQILAQRRWSLDIFELIEQALKLLQEQVELQDSAAENVKNFFGQRVAWLLKEMGIAYDVVASVMHSAYSSVDDLMARATALNALKQEAAFIRLVIGFKRVANIIAQSQSFAALDPSLLEHASERSLHQGLQALSAAIGQALEDLDYPLALQHLVHFGTLIDKFFDDVLVNCEDAALKANRYALLADVRAEFLRVADLSLIVVEIDLNGE